MELTAPTTEAVRQYLQANNIPFVDVEPVTGGSSNYIWRILNSRGETSILKHAQPHLSCNPSTPFPVDRMDFEIQALELIPKIVAEAGGIRYPRILHKDMKNHVLIFENVGQKTLKDLYEDPHLDVGAVGKALSRWLARLHTHTTADEIKDMFNHTTAKRMYRWNYNSLASTLAKFGYEAELGERINAKYGSLLQTDNSCLCHTDLWPGNILFDLEENWPKEPTMAIIDWEVTRSGNGVTDIGHFAAEAWFLDRFRGGRGLLGAFLEGYMEERPLGREEKQRVTAQFGTHITHWAAIYAWINEQRTEESVAYGHGILKHVDEENWEWFEKSDLSLLFRD
ncbi:kinase-like domain-containing protein [Stachybotrys elegans]|uniref:Kinase-like domain-containing protein n=1 Tax=Stachybotrys elegans TaxID=80388 RepID=A0A8K0SNJ9_9HYPO|nr:kinase-like domain-containing protein [Stachybotrys elegans]